jgi:O-antigen/teichoic acid export membrane protein
MPSITKNYFVVSFLWGAFSKVISAFVKVLTVPLLLGYFGKADNALIALVLSINSYLQLLDMGINTGSVKYFSEWIARQRFGLLDSVARTGVTFYGLVGVINAVCLILLAIFGLSVFSVTEVQELTMYRMLVVLAFFTVINWSTSIYNQLLTANEQLQYIQQVNITRSLLELALVGLTILFKLDIVLYFFLYLLLNSLVLFPLYLRCKKTGLVTSFYPATDWKNFGTVFKYSLAIMVMGLFQLSAVKLRPILLSIFTTSGIQIVSDFQVMETITLFIISIGGMLTTIFLPKASKLILDTDQNKVSSFAYEATLYTSIVCVVLCVPLILCAKELLLVYVGPDYLHLSSWLSLWILVILFSLHNSPVASLVLSTGKTRMLVYSSGVACLVSLAINAAYCARLGAGSAVLGYSVYVVIQMSFYYFYFNSRVLKLQSWKVFKSFATPTVIGFTMAGIVMLLDIQMNSLILQAVIKCSIWCVLFAGALLLLNIVPRPDIKKLKTMSLFS